MNKHPEKRRNEAYYPVVFLALFPLAGGSAAMELGLLGGDIALGAFWGMVLGTICYGAYILRKKRGGDAPALQPPRDC